VGTRRPIDRNRLMAQSKPQLPKDRRMAALHFVSMRLVGIALAVVGFAAAQSACAQSGPAVGQPAPPISLESWLNAGKDESPSLESLKGKTILLEFWGTWCHPCVLAMPLVQKLHDRYKDRGLRVLAISYEADDVLQPFLTKNAYTMTVGSDPTKKVINAYGIQSWPTSILIDKDGKIAHIGNPYGIESAIEKALGLEAGPASLLTDAVGALAAKDKKRVRETLERLIDKEPEAFDLKAWSTGAGGTAPPTPAAPAKGEPGDALDRCVADWNAKDPAAKVAALTALAALAPEAFDLTSWAKRHLAAEFPITDKELKQLLEAKSYDAVVEALISRNPPANVVTAAAKSRELRDYCAKKGEEARTFAKKGLMIENWVLAGKQTKDNEGFWQELSVNGIATSADKKTVTAVIVGATHVTKANAAGFVRGNYSRAIVMDSLAAGKEPKLAGLAAAVAKERDAQLKTLQDKYPFEKQ
jgi:thiol-disulfide isomerase/thioredoxin